MKKLTFIFIVFFVILGQALASNIKIDRLSRSVLVLNDDYFRVIAILTEKGIVVIDTHRSVEDMLQCKKIIESEFKTDKYIYVINSHEDLEHLSGNPLFKNALLITHEGFLQGQENMKLYVKEFERQKVEKNSKLMTCDSSTNEYKSLQAEVKQSNYYCVRFRYAQSIKPDITFTDRFTLRFDSLTINLIYNGLGHGHSLFVYIPEEKFLFSGTINRNMPCMFYTLKNNDPYTDVERSLGVLSEFVNVKDSLRYIVPCHGDYLSNNNLKEAYNYYKIMWDGITNAKAENKTLEYIKSEFALERKFGRFAAFKTITEEAQKRQNTNIDLLWDYLVRLQ